MCAFIVDKLESFLKQFPDYPNAFLVGGAADVFVTELADQVTNDGHFQVTDEHVTLCGGRYAYSYLDMISTC